MTLSANPLCAERIYKNLLLCQKDCAGLEKSVGAKIERCETVLGDIHLSPLDWFCGACEEFIMQERDYKAPMDGAAALLEKISFGRRDLLLCRSLFTTASEGSSAAGY